MTPLLELDRVSVHIPVRRGGLFGGHVALRAVDEVSLHIDRGETLAVVGESGSGKTTLGAVVSGLRRQTAGTVRLNGRPLPEHGPRPVQVVFQDPFSALDPRMLVGEIVAEPLRLRGARSEAARERLAAVLEQVGLPADAAERYPHQFSGGQRQRIAIARAIIAEPELVVADEPLSALDVSVQSRVLNLFADIKASRGISYLFISHDLAVVRHLADRVGVLYLGRLVELGAREDVFARPSHPYTQALLASVPRVGRGRRQRGTAPRGEIPSPLDQPSGCVFHPRCPRAQAICREQAPRLEAAPRPAREAGGPRHVAACHFRE